MEPGSISQPAKLAANAAEQVYSEKMDKSQITLSTITIFHKQKEENMAYHKKNHHHHHHHHHHHVPKMRPNLHTSERYRDQKKQERYCIIGLGAGILIGAWTAGVLGGILGGLIGLIGGFILGGIAVAFNL